MVKQHTHNWVYGTFHKRTLGWQWGRSDFWGFEQLQYLKCVRGGKTKHTIPAGPKKAKFTGTFITASGIMPEGWVDEEFARRTGRK